MPEGLNEKIKASLNKSLKTSERGIGAKMADLQSAYAPNILFKVNSLELAQTDLAMRIWSEENGINLVVIEDGDPTYNKYSYASVGNLHNLEYILVSKDQFALLNQPKTVLYLKRADHINDPMTRQHLLDFVSNHIVTFGDEKAYRAKNILFAVATIPNDMEYSDWREIADRFVSIVDLSQI